MLLEPTILEKSEICINLDLIFQHTCVLTLYEFWDSISDHVQNKHIYKRHNLNKAIDR